MKTLAKIFCRSTKKIIISRSRLSLIVTLMLSLLVTGMPGLVSTCIAQSPWTQKADMLYRAFDPSACIFEGKLYIMGGLDHYSFNYRYNALDSVSVYDPEQDSWSLLANMPHNRVCFSSYVYNGKILAIGGDRSLYWTPVSAIDIYDPVSDTWSHLTDIPLAGIWQSSALLDDKIYVFGGAKSETDFLYDNVQIYNLLTDTWSEGEKMLTPRYDGSAIALNDKIYVIGGSEGTSTNYRGMTTVEVYDPATDSWSTETDMIVPRHWHANCLLDSSIYVFGGMSGSCNGWHSGGESYDPKADRWREITPNINLSGPCRIAPYNGNVYVCGGKVTTCDGLSTYDCKSLFLYEPHYDLLLLIEKTEVDKSYANAGNDSICVAVHINDPTGVNLFAKIEAPDQTPVDSLQLYDDGNHNDGNAGDSLYANVWPVSSTEERDYYVDLYATWIDTAAAFYSLNNIGLFTTVGPIIYENHTFTDTDTEPNPGDQLRFELTLKNNGKIATATNITAKLFSLDTLVTVSAQNMVFGDIAAGENAASLSKYILVIDDEWPGNTDIPIAIEIKSEDYLFWRDTFSIMFKTNLEDIAEPITRIYPNPTDNMLNIEISNTGKQELEIEILDITGKVLYQKEYKNISAHFTKQIDLSQYTKGIFLLKVRQDNSIYVGKVVVR